MEGALHLEPGQVVQGQKLVERVGEGGFGEVWKAEYYGQAVAVKFFHRVDRLEGSRRESIAQYVLGRLKTEDGGRFFPRVEHFDLDATPAYMRMELVDGKSLNHYFTRQPRMELGRALRVAEDLLSALVVVHDLGFVHGDLSASNVLVGADDKVKLIDVGYGVLFHDSGQIALSTSPSTNLSVGTATPLYSAPERFTQEFLAGDNGKRADVFSFGKLLYQVLTWESPSTVKPVHRTIPSLTEAWDDFVYQCVSEKPQDRFADAREALTAFQQLPLVVEMTPGAGRTDTRVRQSLGKFRSLVEIALADRVLTDEEREYLHRKAVQMGIPADQAEQVIRETTPGARGYIAPVPVLPIEPVTPAFGTPPLVPPPIMPRIEGMTVTCGRCSQANVVPPGGDPAFFACSACGANLGSMRSGCPRCGCGLEARNSSLHGCTWLFALLFALGGTFLSLDREFGPAALVGGFVLALVISLVAPKKRTWRCPACHAEYAHPPGPASQPVGSPMGLGCLFLLLLLAAGLGVVFLTANGSGF